MILYEVNFDLNYTIQFGEYNLSGSSLLILLIILLIVILTLIFQSFFRELGKDVYHWTKSNVLVNFREKYKKFRQDRKIQADFRNLLAQLTIEDTELRKKAAQELSKKLEYSDNELVERMNLYSSIITALKRSNAPENKYLLNSIILIVRNSSPAQLNDTDTQKLFSTLLYYLNQHYFGDVPGTVISLLILRGKITLLIDLIKNNDDSELQYKLSLILQSKREQIAIAELIKRDLLDYIGFLLKFSNADIKINAILIFQAIINRLSNHPQLEEIKQYLINSTILDEMGALLQNEHEDDDLKYLILITIKTIFNKKIETGEILLKIAPGLKDCAIGGNPRLMRESYSIIERLDMGYSVDGKCPFCGWNKYEIIGRTNGLGTQFRQCDKCRYKYRYDFD